PAQSPPVAGDVPDGLPGVLWRPLALRGPGGRVLGLWGALERSRAVLVRGSGWRQWGCRDGSCRLGRTRRGQGPPGVVPGRGIAFHSGCGTVRRLAPALCRIPGLRGCPRCRYEGETPG